MSVVVVVKVFTVMNVRFKKFSPKKATVVTLLLPCKKRYVRGGNLGASTVKTTSKSIREGRYRFQFEQANGIGEENRRKIDGKRKGLDLSSVAKGLPMRRNQSKLKLKQRSYQITCKPSTGSCRNYNITHILKGEERKGGKAGDDERIWQELGDENFGYFHHAGHEGRTGGRQMYTSVMSQVVSRCSVLTLDSSSSSECWAAACSGHNTAHSPLALSPTTHAAHNQHHITSSPHQCYPQENATPTQLFTRKAATQACDRDGRTHGQPAPSTAGTVVILGWDSG
ncbi:hypothetical protein RUM43_012001 [Polyplax serrata]|uniref:Uncharacterized protein n=1 Tax=Polyplax serrata TaxID=468196 RepID=A0AAN8Q3K7_POLSC